MIFSKDSPWWTFVVTCLDLPTYLIVKHKKAGALLLSMAAFNFHGQTKQASSIGKDSLYRIRNVKNLLKHDIKKNQLIGNLAHAL